MTVTPTYDATLARVQIAVTGVPAAADHVLIERSADQIRWVTVRGGATVPIVSNAASLDDYEFTPNVVNYYRASSVDTGPTANVGVGTAATAVNGSVVPAHPVGLLAGDTKLLLASIRNSGTGTVNTPTGWTPLVISGNVALFGRRHVTGDTAPTVTFAGGVANADCIAQMYAARNMELIPVTSAEQLNGSAQNIAFPGLTITVDNCRIIACGWKQDDWTGSAAPGGFTENDETTSAAGDDASQTWARALQTTATNVSAASFTITGGGAAISRGLIAAFRPADYIIQETGSVTPPLDRVWLKSLARPFLNRPVTVVDVSEVTRPSRSGVFDIVGRSAPVAVTELRGSRRYTLVVLTDTTDDATTLDLLLASGDAVLVHTPASINVPGMYAVVGDTAERRFGGSVPANDPRLFGLPLTEVAAPGADVVGATITWQGVLNEYATWADLIAAQSTWADVLELIGDPTDVIVS